MKKAMIIIRPEKYKKTKAALEKAGFSAFNTTNVFGRGKAAVNFCIASSDQEKGQVTYHRFIPKTMITVVIRDEDEKKLVSVVIDTNRTNNSGDGKIFIIPVSESIRIRTGETKDEALV